MRPLLLAPALLLAAPLLAACTESTAPSSDAAAGDDVVTVSSTDDACEVSSTEVPSGKVTFEVTNDGSQVTEFYLLAGDGQAIKGEVENVGPEATRQLVLAVPPGDYVTACKPGMSGEGIRADFTVTDSGADLTPTGDDAELVDQAVTQYQAYVQDQSDQLLAGTKAFVKAYENGDDDQARALYPVARTHWERIETVAESFGDLDPKMDAREADLEAGQRWTGWHLMEKDLWPARADDYTALTPKQRRVYGDDLLANTDDLVGRIAKLELTVDQIANGSRGLLEEVATGKVTGEEEYWSRTDLYDFQANVDGARVAFEGVRPLLERNDPDLADQLDERFTALQKLLDQHRDAAAPKVDGQSGFVGYDQLSTSEVKQLADAVNALAEPLSRLTAAVLA
ncbi:iron uptake system protein EfeO [Nocardioides acrostichi]|uniref:Cupredoxin domain-containing protein n=1 Tax=Nocardioides acrostichi TaxID=2784339 RepID=A0A930UUE6_9ACTN|nr:iron uptake system protein EfeO [Nocardioides acrostichi]MBF4160376.1 cupredoxin domain-containing protein [Nocardioides acrostichi]